MKDDMYGKYFVGAKCAGIEREWSM